uniref:Uncharacterized protein n=1 Tax=Arundo donax TaxID=35708 RepID=A0A0A9FCT2_ARUDO
MPYDLVELISNIKLDKKTK